MADETDQGTQNELQEPQDKQDKLVQESSGGIPGLDFLGDIPLEVTVEVGRTEKPVAELLELGPSSIIQLNKGSTEPLDLRVNGVLVAHGEAVVVNEHFGIRLTSIVESDRLLKSVQQEENDNNQPE
jgi:flagellar motor switch protein FliN/FliY